MRCAISQPTYLPWIGYFDIIDQVDKFVFLDNVQLVKRSWGVRNRIKTAQGELMLSVAIKKTEHRDNILYNSAHINDEVNWRKKHLSTINQAYRKSEHFDVVFPKIEELILNSETILSELNINFIQSIAQLIGIETEFKKASTLENVDGRKDELLVSICRAINCENYLSTKGSSVYIEADNPGGVFPENKINLFYHNYEHPEYTQLYPPFLPYMGIIDALFNIGFENILNVIRSGRGELLDSSNVNTSETQ